MTSLRDFLRGRQLWGGEFWEDGYFVCTVGDKVTAEIIRKYIEYHRDHEKIPEQLKFFLSKDAPPLGGVIH